MRRNVDARTSPTSATATIAAVRVIGWGCRSNGFMLITVPLCSQFATAFENTGRFDTRFSSPFHTVLNRTVSSRLAGKRPPCSDCVQAVEPAEQAVRRRSGESDEGRASTTGGDRCPRGPKARK